MEASPEVTVVVPVKDRRERMLACLEDLLAQDHPSYEILVLDNDSNDGTAEACLQRAGTARVPVRVEVVPGTLGHVRNRARDLARGRLIAFTDSDCSPVPAWLSEGVVPFAAGERIGIVCGRTEPASEPDRPWPHTVTIPRFSRRFEACNLFVRADAFRDSDGFDEVVGDGWEDTAAGYELLARGWSAAFAPKALVRHDVSYPGFWWHVRREQRQAGLGRVGRRYPEVRRRLMFAHWFFSPRSAAFACALAGLAAGTRAPRARLLTLTYVPFLVRFLLHVRFRGPWPALFWQVPVFDAALHVAQLRGAIRYRGTPRAESVSARWPAEGGQR